MQLSFLEFLFESIILKGRICWNREVKNRTEVSDKIMQITGRGNRTIIEDKKTIKKRLEHAGLVRIRVGKTLGGRVIR